MYIRLLGLRTSTSNLSRASLPQYTPSQSSPGRMCASVEKRNSNWPLRSSKDDLLQHQSWHTSTLTAMSLLRLMPLTMFLLEYFLSMMTMVYFTQSLSFQQSTLLQNATMKYTIRNLWPLYGPVNTGVLNSNQLRIPFKSFLTIRTWSTS